MPRLDAVRRAVALCGLLLAVSCGKSEQERSLPRRGPLGSLRDLVFFDRSIEAGGPFFLDRFEATRADFAEFAASAAGAAIGARSAKVRDDQSAMPIADLDLSMARAFAKWRNCRLMRADEWAFACTTDGRDAFPWGSRPDPSRANTADLGVFAPLPVGTFESGRLPLGVYDLIGNVAEWTESAPAQAFANDGDAFSGFRTAQLRFAQSPALSCWSPAPFVAAPAVVVELAGDGVPREAVGGDFASLMVESRELRAPSDRSDRIGVRFATSPRELVESIGERALALEGEDLEQWLRFCARAQHASALAQGVALASISAACRARWQEALP